MRTSRSRRSLLSSMLPFTVALAGCFDGQFTSGDDPDSEFVPADDYDCDDIDRPEPAEQTDDDAPVPASYPAAPTVIPADGDQYALEFETAYRRNQFLEEYGSQARSFEFQYEASQRDALEPESAAESERDAILVAMVYGIETATEQGENTPEWGTRVSYYIDENVTLRAHYQGPASEPTVDPDPRDEGIVVDCFE